MHRSFQYVVLVLLLAGLSGCASYSQGFQQVEALLAQGKPKEALAELNKTPPAKADRFLHFVDQAMLQRMAGLYAQSNQSFEQAKAVIEELDGISLVEQAGALTINDAALSYEGESYEQVAIHLYAALNYIQLGLWDEARVEALQVDVRLKALAKAQDDDDPNVYTEDAFSRYLTGIIYEQGGEFSDAMIAYRKAYQAYVKYGKKFTVAVPSFLKADLLRLSKQVGLVAEHKKYQKLFQTGDASTKQGEQVDEQIDEQIGKKKGENTGEVVFIFQHSLAPIKRAQEIIVHDDKGLPLRISMPYYQSRRSAVRSIRLHVGKQSVDAALAGNFDAIARASLASHRAAMIIRLIARTILKKKAAAKAEENGGGLAGFLVNVAGVFTETADTRSWLTLPKNIHFARMSLQEGVYPASISLLGKHGGTIAKIPLADVHIQRGKKTILEHTWLGLSTSP